jgi:hypothetical protein
MRKRNHYKFSRKEHSKRGMLACFLAAASIFALLYLVADSFYQDGSGSVYLGSAGLLALVVAVVAFVQAAKSLGEENSYRGIPVASMLLSILAAGSWAAVYALGFWLS